MTYFVWAQYFYPAPVGKTIKSYEVEFGKKHVHGQKPSANEIAEVSNDLLTKVTDAGNAAQQNPAVPADYAPDVRTRSTKD